MDLDAKGFDLLRRSWQPVARSVDLPPGGIVSYTLLDEDIVLARLDEHELLAARDRCPHRGARFGIGDVHQGNLRCPYHGWSFDAQGACTGIPSLKDPQHPACAQARLTTFDVQERYGLVWVKLDPGPETAPLPQVPEYENAAWAYRVPEPMAFGCGFRREIDNYLDMSHFAFAHATTLGVAAQRVIDDVRLDHYGDGLEMNAPFPAVSAPGEQPGKLQSPHHRQQRVHLPNFTTIRQTFSDGDERVLLHVPSPNTRETCTVFWALATSPGFDGPPIDEQIAFAVRVLDEDRIMVENQVPAEVPVGAEEGVTVPADRFAMAFKRSWREFIDHGGVRQAAATTTASGKSIAIAWGSQSGNAETLAAELGRELGDQGHNVAVHDCQAIGPSDLMGVDLALVITSTYGDGDPPDNAEDFVEALADDDLDLSGLPFAVCALGDSAYEHFCGCGKTVDRLLEERGGIRQLARVDCDADYDEAFADWRDQVLALLTANGSVPV